VAFFGGPCDGLEQSAIHPPPMPEYLQPRGGNLDAVYCVVQPVTTTTVGRDVCTKYRFEFP
jgi:hypothetical protein